MIQFAFDTKIQHPSGGPLFWIEGKPTCFMRLSTGERVTLQWEAPKGWLIEGIYHGGKWDASSKHCAKCGGHAAACKRFSRHERDALLARMLKTHGEELDRLREQAKSVR